MVPMIPFGNTYHGIITDPSQMQQEHETRHNRRQLFRLDNTMAPYDSTAHRVAMAPVTAQPLDTNMATGGRPDPAPEFLMLGLSVEKQSLLFLLRSCPLLPYFAHPLPNWHTWEGGRFFMTMSTGTRRLC